jgi:NADPH:quinone reductase-like Zn-dependent oxidoreductase
MAAALEQASTPARETSTTGTATMSAIVQDAYGTEPEAVLRTAAVARPTITDDQVLVRVMAASVDRGTWHIMTGLPYAIRLAGFGVRRPKAANPGRCLAGVVEAVGGSVTGFAPGDEVYGTGTATFAEYAVATPGRLTRKPANLTFEQAAAVPISAVTALGAVRDTAGVQRGQSVLVIGASGGVGSFAVQMAKALGAEVTGVCRTDKTDLVRSLGADHVLDHTRQDITAGDRRYDVVIDMGGNRRLGHLRRALTPKGTLVIVGGETGGRWLGGFGRSLRAVALSALVGQTLAMHMAKENAADLADVTDLIESGAVVPAIERTYPLPEAPAAIRHLHEGHARGKLTVTI